MAALLDLEQTIRSKRELVTRQEANVLMAWRGRAVRDFTVGFCGGSVVTWLATRRLSNLFRINLTLGAGAAYGIWRFGRSVQSSIQHVLSLERSRIQRELAIIMLTKYYRDPRVLPYLSKYFFKEEVYDDTSVDRPTSSWRYRNFSGETVDHSQSTSYNSDETRSDENGVEKTTMEPNQVHVNSAGDAMENPFDLIFGISESAESVANTVEISSLSRKESRKEKRSRRRHRRHHHQEESDM
ncbi:hypothetical protein OROGR_028132 [Orobanche gracilis]